MNWVKENKFLAGFAAVMLVGVGVLGYLTYSAMGKYEEAAGEFDSASAQLKNLQDTKPALTDANLKELIAQKQEMNGKIAAFQQELKARVLPEEPIAKEAFQDMLKATVARVSAKAAEAKVERPKDFYMALGEYQAKPPEAKAAPALARQLRAIELVMNVLTDAGKLELEELQRDTLPEESGKPKPASEPPRPGRKGSPDDDAERKAVERTGLKVKFTSTDTALHKILAGLANHKQQLFVIRKISIQNKQAESPPRIAVGLGVPSAPDAPGAPAPAPAPAPDAAPAPGAPPAEGSPTAAPTSGPLAYVFGKERITTLLELEILKIADPEVKADKSGKPKRP